MAKQRRLFCVDRVIPWDRKADAARAAVKENPANRPKMMRMLPGVSAHPVKISIVIGKTWKKGRVLGVHFMDGSKHQREMVRGIASTWSDYANIRFNFKAGSNAQIRVSFEYDPGSSWSAVGVDCLDHKEFPKNLPTMNYGWLTDDTDDTEYRRVVLHEFGHALGAIHEHQVPAGGITWNMAKVYAYFSGPPNNWSKADIDFNVIEKYSVNQLNGTRFDPKSIMLYGFPPELIKGPASFKKMASRENTKLSAKDKSFMHGFYSR